MTVDSKLYDIASPRGWLSGAAGSALPGAPRRRARKRLELGVPSSGSGYVGLRFWGSGFWDILGSRAFG